MKQAWLLLILILLPCYSYSKVAVTSGAADTVNFIYVLFELTACTGASSYELLFCKKYSRYHKGRSLKNKILLKRGMAFGNQYNWLYRCYDKKSRVVFTSSTSQLYIIGLAVADTTQFRYPVSAYNKAKTEDGLILLDMDA